MIRSSVRYTSMSLSLDAKKSVPGQYPFRVVIQERNIEPLLARVREVEIVNPSPGDSQHQIGVAVQQRHRTGVLEGIHIDELPG